MKSDYGQINFTSTAELFKARPTNKHVVKMAGSPLSESVVVRVIGVYDSEFDTSDRRLLTLKRKGVSGKVIAAMLSKGLKTGTSGESPPPLTT
jgi:hypothetical protein